ncbi:MAG: uroporphyrinogen decarboxylase family protein [Verrucomicrobiota bacterium]|mgnify:CR=1 FL=1|jgi:hypothetical protein|nr:uroporphyrinogen decarboxylase family protein [Verrucomicrobiota bacterium]MDI9385837.1 uroporphyrinogen decarboxylase family protein [Verrucomicrobiota bacterium]HCF95763.1 hypothetical protein [Verrucomicrobiota bacterium]
MGSANEQLFQQRLKRYVTAMRNGKPDMVPIRPFVAEFTAKYAGMTCQEVSLDYNLAFQAARKCAADFDWDAVVGNMVYVWTGLTEAIGLKYYGVPGIHFEPDMAFQYREPAEDAAFMKADEYDALIDDPTGYMYETWLPRASAAVCGPGQVVTKENNLSFTKGGMAMLAYFNAFGEQARLMREEAAMPGAICGILKAPLDILADKFRGYLGLLDDLRTQPEKVKAACEAIAPHLYNVALGSSDPTGTVPVGFWMHRSCVPFVSFDTFNEIFWPTLKPIILELWKQGRQTLFYAEGNWNHHLDRFAELPAGSIVYHVDQGDIFRVHEVLGKKFCLSGGIPNAMLSYGSPEEVRQRVTEVIEGVAQDGGYILDASAIVQNDASIENMRVMTQTGREIGRYAENSGDYALPEPLTSLGPEFDSGLYNPDWARSRLQPGVCIPWEARKSQLPPIIGDEALVRRIWEEVDAYGNMYIWQVLLSF